MTIPRQLAPTMGPAHGGVEFLKGSFFRVRGVHNFSGEARAGVKRIYASTSSQIGMYEIEIVLGLHIVRPPDAPW